jgi:transposase
VLEERGFALMLVNARHVKILPGHKTDVCDAAWLCELLECGLLRGSFVPPASIRELRDLIRYRKRLIQAHASEGQRIQKTLEDAGIKLDSVAADVLGVSGRAMLTALVGGERDPQVLAELPKGRLRNKLPQLRQALRGRFGDHHALLVRLALGHLEQLEGAIAALDRRVEEVIAPLRPGQRSAGHHHRGGQAGRRDDHCRDRRGHDGVPHRRASGLVGGPLSGQQPHRRQAPLGQADQGQPLAGGGAHRVRLGGGSQS